MCPGCVWNYARGRRLLLERVTKYSSRESLEGRTGCRGWKLKFGQGDFRVREGSQILQDLDQTLKRAAGLQNWCCTFTSCEAQPMAPCSLFLPPASTLPLHWKAAVYHCHIGTVFLCSSNWTCLQRIELRINNYIQITNTSNFKHLENLKY